MGEDTVPQVISNQRILVWEDGRPTVRHRNLDGVPRDIVDDVGFSALLLPYLGEKTIDPDDIENTIYDLDPRFDGMTNLEVAQIKQAEKAANGDSLALKQMLDRVAGTPINKHVNVTDDGTIENFLNQITKGKTGVIDVTPRQQPHNIVEIDGDEL